jgi:centrosomal protein CEP290
MVPCPAGRLQLAKAEEEAALATASHHELEQALQVMEGSTDSEVRQQYIETVRRMAVVQIKHAKLARELEVRSRGGGGRRGK